MIAAGMATPSLPYRVRSLLRRISNRLDQRIRVPVLFVLSVKNWRKFFSGEQQQADITYALRSGYELTVPKGTTNVSPYVDVWLRRVYDHPRIAWQDVRTIIDVGAHIGAFSLYAARRSPLATIHAYEPDPQTFPFLARNIEQNKLTKRIHAHEAAVGERSGKAQLNILPERSEANSMYRALPGSRSAEVSVTRLQDIFEEQKIVTCDILKMNAEGVEYEIFYGLPAEFFSRISAIVMNYHVFVEKPKANAQDLTSYLEKHGFSVQETAKRILVAIRKG